jgi:hypothetical protein
MQPPPGFAVRALFVASGLVACETKSSGPATPSARPSATAIRSVPPPAPSAEPPPEIQRCRVITARQNPSKRPGAGDAAKSPEGDSELPAVGTVFEGRSFIELGPGEIVLRHAATTRELSLKGPGRFLPCFLGTETVLVARGSVKTTAGAGARAGAEVVLATPFGTLHFADAALEARVAERELDIRIENGVVTLVPATGKPSADAGTTDLVLGPKSKKRLSSEVDVKLLLERCGEASRPLGTAPPTAPSARSELGKWSVEQLKARQTARWACATARAATGRAEEPERTRLSREIESIDRVWLGAGLEARK